MGDSWGKLVLRIIIALLLILLVGPFLIPVSPLDGTVPPEQLADPDGRFVQINGLQVHYKIVGQGEPTAEDLALVLLHGLAASVLSWREVMEPELVVIPECGHLPQEEHPELLLQAVSDFLSQLP